MADIFETMPKPPQELKLEIQGQLESEEEVLLLRMGGREVTIFRFTVILISI